MIPNKEKPENFVYVIPGSWMRVQRISNIAQDLLLCMAINMNDKNVVVVTRWFKEEFIKAYPTKINMPSVDAAVGQLSREGLTKKLMNGVYEVSKDIYLHKSAMDA